MLHNEPFKEWLLSSNNQPDLDMGFPLLLLWWQTERTKCAAGTWPDIASLFTKLWKASPFLLLKYTQRRTATKRPNCQVSMSMLHIAGTVVQSLHLEGPEMERYTVLWAIHECNGMIGVPLHLEGLKTMDCHTPMNDRHAESTYVWNLLCYC